MAFVVVRAALQLPRTHGQHGLRAIQCLVAVGMPVTQHPPHRSPRAAFPHGAPILDGWRQSGLRGKVEEHEAAGSIDQPVFAYASTSGGVSGFDGSKWSAKAG
jgi:hypothetical protein